MGASEMIAGARRLARGALRPVARPLLDAAAAARLARLARRPSDPGRPARVAFLLQCPEVWDKLEDVYEAMWASPGFEPVLVALPDPSVRAWDEVPASEMSRASENFCAARYADRDVVLAVEEGGKVCDLRRMGFDYVFYQRPYDSKLPVALRSARVSRWSRVCIVSYGYILAKVYERVVFTQNRGFFRNASFAFLDSDYMRDRMREAWAGSPGLEFRHLESLGYPALARYARLRRGEGPCRRVLWTPRWSYDPSVGGSHFLEYGEGVLGLARSGLEVRIRPHQLMWDELVRTGMMTGAEVERFRDEALDAGCEFSGGGDCMADFEWSDVLLTDFSSIFVEYFLTGRPIVFCPPEYELTGSMLRMLEGAYVADGWSEAESCIAMLATGEDPKSFERENILVREFGDVSGSATAIVERVRQDHIVRSRS